METSTASSDVHALGTATTRTQPRLLVIDHQHAFTGFARLVAQKLGYEVRVLTDSRHVASGIVECEADVLMLDVVMPELDGIEVINILAHRGYKGHLILVTAHDSSYLDLAKKMAEARNLNVAAAMVKPVRRPAIEKILREMVA